jgi:hypothetical protein
VFPDEAWYLDLAANILSRGVYRLTDEGGVTYALCKAPGLPFVLAGVGCVAPLAPLTAKLVSSAASWAAVLILALTAWRVFRPGGPAARVVGRCVPVLAVAALAGLHPAFAYLGTTNYPQSFQALFLALSVSRLAARLHCGRARVEGRRRNAWVDGLLVGAGALFVPTHLLVLPAIVLAGRPRGGAWRGTARAALFAALGAASALAPWILRNALVERDFVPITVTAGQQFYAGFNDDAGMNTGVNTGVPAAMEEDLRNAGGAREFGAVHYRYAADWVRQNPARAAGLWGVKLINYFRWDNGRLKTRAAQGGRAVQWLQRITSVVVFGILLAGCLRLWSRERRWVYFSALLLGTMAAGHAFFVSRYRYRLPLEPALLFVGLLGLFLDRAAEPAGVPEARVDRACLGGETRKS